MLLTYVPIWSLSWTFTTAVDRLQVQMWVPWLFMLVALSILVPVTDVSFLCTVLRLKVWATVSTLTGTCTYELLSPT